MPQLQPKRESDSEQTLLISLVLSDTTVQALLWKTTGAQVEIVNQSQIKNFKDQESLVVAADETLQELGPESEPVNQVIFAVPEDWVEKSDIKAEKKPLLKKITTELELKPEGYVVVEEALTFYFKKQEPQFSALIMGISANDLHLRLFKFGKEMSTQVVGRSDDIIADLTEGLARLQHLDQIKALPTKFQLYSVVLLPEELIELQQKMVNYDWTKDDTFFYQPIFEVVTPEILALAIAFQAHFSLKGEASVPPAPVVSEKTAPQPELELEPEELKEEETVPQATAKSFGIPIAMTPPPQLEEPAVEEEPDSKVTSTPASSNKLKRFVFAHKFALLGGFIAGVLALLVLAFIASKTILAAQIQIDLKGQIVTKDVEFTLDPEATQSDPEQLLLAARVVNKEVSGEKTGATSGVKLIGDNATGKVEIFNKTTAEKTFEAGTVLSSGDLKFVLDSEVTVASASVSESSSSETKTYGKVEATVTASEIGAAGNIAKDTTLNVASFDSSSYEATSLADFTGGSSREVRVVSQKDREELQAALLQELAKQAEAAFQEDSTDGKYVVGTGTSEISSSEFDAKVGDEANNLKLQLTATFEGVEYAAEDLKPLARAVLADQIPDGFHLVDEDPNILSVPAQEASSSGQVKLDAQVSAQAVPEVNYEEWKQEVRGKSKSTALALLAARPEVQHVELAFQPAWLGRIFPWLPSALDKITFTTQQ